MNSNYRNWDGETSESIGNRHGVYRKCRAVTQRAKGDKDKGTDHWRLLNLVNPLIVTPREPMDGVGHRTS